MEWVILDLRKWLQTAMHWLNRLFLTLESHTLHLLFLDSVKQCYLQTKNHTVTSSERAHSITWYKQNRCWNRWASKQVSRRYRFQIKPKVKFLKILTQQNCSINNCGVRFNIFFKTVYNILDSIMVLVQTWLYKRQFGITQWTADRRDQMS